MCAVEGPDQGKAWLVAFAACIINMILSGLSRMIGLLYVAVIDAYGVSRAEATLPFTVRNSIRCLSGPLVGIIGQRYGIRTVTLCGGVIAALGAALCSVAPTVIWLTVFWGGIHGFGFAFANTLFQVVVNQYFEKYRATASGIALSGACLGSLALPILMEFFLDKFGLSGTFLIVGGLVMHVLPAALFLRAPPWLKKGIPKVNGCPQDICHRDLSNSTSMSNNPVEGIEVLSVRRLTISESVLPKGQHQANATSAIKTITNGANGVNALEADYVQEICEEIQEENDNTKVDKVGCLYHLKGIVKLYSNPVYVLINVCMATYLIIFLPILTVIVDYSVDKGFPVSYGKYFINAMAIGDLIGRMCFGWVTDRGFITIPRFMTLILVAEGVIICLFPHAMTIYFFMGLLALYGVMAGSMLVLFPILVLKYVSLEEQPVAMGCVGFLSGLVSFGLTPLIGHFRDNVGSYDGMFYITGGISVISGGFWFLEPFLAKIHLKQLSRNQS